MKDPFELIPRASTAPRRALAAFVPLLLAVALVAGWQEPARAADPPSSFADLAESLLPTVVNISTTQAIEPGGRGQEFEEFFRDFFERREGQPQPPRRGPSSLGSGFVIDPRGYIVTNNHVIAEADEITVRFHDDTTREAEVVGRDDKTDLALLKVEADEPLIAAEWGDSKQTRIGDWIVAIGNPFGLGGTVTAGIVSARARDINAGPYDDFLQTDASINRGNSGGPMFNLDGKVIGVNTAIFSPSGGSIGIGFAIPSAMARNVIEQLREFGKVRRGWLGVRIQTVTDELAEGLRLGEPRGALVASVSEGGPAARSGIKQGDVILRFDGRPVEEMRKLPRMVAETQIGRTVEVVVWRKGEEQTIQVDIGRMTDEKLARFRGGEEGGGEEGEEPALAQVAALGLKLAPLDEEMRQRYDIEEGAEGVVITEVAPAGSAAEKGLSAGDIIVEVDQDKVSTPTEIAQKVAEAKEGGYRVVTMLVLRQGEFQWVALRIAEG